MPILSLFEYCSSSGFGHDSLSDIVGVNRLLQGGSRVRQREEEVDAAESIFYNVMSE